MVAPRWRRPTRRGPVSLPAARASPWGPVESGEKNWRTMRVFSFSTSRITAPVRLQCPAVRQGGPALHRARPRAVTASSPGLDWPRDRGHRQRGTVAGSSAGWRGDGISGAGDTPRPGDEAGRADLRALALGGRRGGAGDLAGGRQGPRALRRPLIAEDVDLSHPRQPGPVAR